VPGRSGWGRFRPAIVPRRHRTRRPVVAIHLATALSVGADLVTYDERLAAAARSHVEIWAPASERVA
jgi:predicted nucleic acid-binding protein